MHVPELQVVIFVIEYARSSTAHPARCKDLRRLRFGCGTVLF